MIDETEQDLLISEMRLISIAAKLGQAKAKSDGRYDPTKLEESIRQVVAATHLVDELLDSRHEAAAPPVGETPSRPPTKIPVSRRSSSVG